jgi:hypothetical protein
MSHIGVGKPACSSRVRVNFHAPWGVNFFNIRTLHALQSVDFEKRIKKSVHAL